MYFATILRKNLCFYSKQNTLRSAVNMETPNPSKVTSPPQYVTCVVLLINFDFPGRHPRTSLVNCVT